MPYMLAILKFFEYIILSLIITKVNLDLPHLVYTFKGVASAFSEFGNAPLYVGAPGAVTFFSCLSYGLMSYRMVKVGAFTFNLFCDSFKGLPIFYYNELAGSSLWEKQHMTVAQAQLDIFRVMPELKTRCINKTHSQFLGVLSENVKLHKSLGHSDIALVPTWMSHAQIKGEAITAISYYSNLNFILGSCGKTMSKHDMELLVAAKKVFLAVL